MPGCLVAGVGDGSAWFHDPNARPGFGRARECTRDTRFDDMICVSEMSWDAGAWLATPVGVIALWLLGEWFSSTTPGILVALTVGPLSLFGLALSIAGLFYVVRISTAA